MAKGKYPDMLKTFLAMAGNDNTVTVHRATVDFLGDLETALLMEQLLYWTPRAKIPGDWVAKSDADFQEEIHISRYSIRKARKSLEKLGILETKVKRFNGSPTTHYRIIIPALERQWADYLNSQDGLSEIEQSDYAKSNNPLSENEQTLTETTPEPTQETTLTDNPHSHKDMVSVLAEVMGMDLGISANWGRLGKMAKSLLEADYSPADVRSAFGKGGYWYKNDWRGKKGQLPDQSSINKHIGVYSGRVKVETDTSPRDDLERRKRLWND